MRIRFSIRDLLWLTALVAVVFGFLVFMYVKSPTIHRWEYQWVMSSGTAGPINVEGNNGWEACGVADRNGSSIVLMKRPKR
jgi:hypothetical protein